MANYNAYLVKAEGIIWKFNNINKAIEFVRTMLTADGQITVQIMKVENAYEEGGEN